MPCCNTAKYKRLQRVLCRQCNYTTHGVKQHTGLCSGVSGYFPYFASVVWSVCKAILRHLRHVGAYHSAEAPSAHTRYHRHARTLHRSAQPQTMQARRGLLPLCADRWKVLHPAHLLMGHLLHLYRVSPLASRYFPRPAACSLAPGQRSRRTGWRPPPGGAFQQQGCGGRRGTIGGLRRLSFRAFAR